jgi:hypothetical protein
MIILSKTDPSKGIAILITGLVIATAVLTGCGSGKSESTSTVPRPSAKPPVYHLAEYDMETGWVQEVSDQKVGSYLESSWHDPASVPSKIVIDSRPAAGATPPFAAAELARAQTNRLRDYKERSFKRVKLGKRSAVRWAYFAAGEYHIAYFFEECDTSIMFHGSTAPISYEPFSEFYGVVASRVKAVCDA